MTYVIVTAVWLGLAVFYGVIIWVLAPQCLGSVKEAARSASRAALVMLAVGASLLFALVLFSAVIGLIAALG